MNEVVAYLWTPIYIEQ